MLSYSDNQIKIIIEAQHAVGHPQLRGLGYYAMNLIQALLRRRAFDYGLTFFDYNCEVGNQERADRLFGGYGVPLYECNELDYRVASRDNDIYASKSYNEWTNTHGDLYHFTNLVAVPTNLKGEMVVTIHDIYWKSAPESVEETLRLVYGLGLSRIEQVAPPIITDSQSTRLELLQYTKVRAEQISVIYPSYDEKNLYCEKGNVSDVVEGEYLFYVGALAPNKNIPGIVQAFNSIATKYDNLKLVIAGKVFLHHGIGPNDSSIRPISQCISNSPFSDRIITPGYVTAEQKRRLYSNALCFVFPSLCEGFGLPVLEAMACGCPVITADNTSLPEVGGEAAVYVNAYDTEQLAHEIERVITSESLRKEMITKGFAQSKKFSWEKTAEQVENLYRAVKSCG